MSQENQDDLYGKIEVRDDDLIKRQLRKAALEVEALQLELDKIDVNISDEDITASQPRLTEDTSELTKDVNIQFDTSTDYDERHEVTTISKEFRKVESEPKTVSIIDPVLNEPWKPRSPKKEDINIPFDPVRPDLGRIVNISDDIKSKIADYYYDRGHNLDVVFYLTPQEFLNIAKPIPIYDDYDVEEIEDLRQSIFETYRGEDFTSLPFLFYNIDTKTIIGHEGRHRAFAMHMQQLRTGEQLKMPVRINFKMGGSNYSRNEHDISLFPLDLPDITREDELGTYYRLLMESTGVDPDFDRPTIDVDTTVEKYRKDFIEYVDIREAEVERAKTLYQQRQADAEKIKKEKIKKIIDKIGGVMEKVTDTILFERDVKLPRDIDVSDYLFEISADFDPKIDDNIVTYSDYFKYDIDRNTLIIRPFVDYHMHPENVKRLIEEFGGDYTFDIELEEVTKLYERSKTWTPTREEEDVFVENVLNNFNSSVDDTSTDASSSDEEDMLSDMMDDAFDSFINDDAPSYDGSVESTVKSIGNFLDMLEDDDI